MIVMEIYKTRIQSLVINIIILFINLNKSDFLTKAFCLIEICHIHVNQMKQLSYFHIKCVSCYNNLKYFIKIT